MARNQLISKYNRTRLQRSKKDIQYIVVHYVGELGDAKANAEWYAGGDRRASADFYVGFSGDVWQGNRYYDYYSWHCGGGRQSTHGGECFGQCKNSNSVGIEMCVRKCSTKSMLATDSDWFFEYATVQATVQLVQELMQELDIDIDHVIRHYDVTGKYCPNPYLDELHPGEWARFKALVSGSAPAEVQWYRVRKSWKDEKSQLGAYEQLANAKANCTSGYSVYDSTGKCIYTAPATVKPVKSGLQQADLQGLTEEQFIAKIGPLAQADMQKTGVLASITLAQCILESGWASTELAKRANNLFGMKIVLSSNSWPSVWDGKSKVNIRTQEQTKSGQAYYIHADFRQYPCIEDSLADHSAYLTGAKNGSQLRYTGLKGCTDYVQAATIIKRGGYATDVEYVQKLTRIIKEHDLTRFDVVKNESNTEPVIKSAPKTEFQVRVTSDVLRIRRGAGLRYDAVGYTGKGIFTITETCDGWGKLKSGAGWIYLGLKCVQRI